MKLMMLMVMIILMSEIAISQKEYNYISITNITITPAGCQYYANGAKIGSPGC
jgi:hypothetical protein